MALETGKKSRLIVLFILGIIFLNYPILSLFSDAKKEIFGIPLFFAYILTTWALLIGLTFMTVRSHRKQDAHHFDKVS